MSDYLRLATIAELGAELDITNYASHTAIFTTELLAAQGIVERYCQRRFSPVLTPDDGSGGAVDANIAKTFTVGSSKFVRVPDLRTVSSIVLNGATLDATTYDLGYRSDDMPTTFIELGWGNTRLPTALTFGKVSAIGGLNPRNLVVTGKWGFASCPSDVKHAVLVLAARMYKQRQASFADTVMLDNGSMIAYLKQLSPEVKLALDSYRVSRSAVVA